MAFYPDIVVTSPDSPRIVMAVEARLNDGLDAAAEHLRLYLVRMSCPLGLVILPGELRIYRNLYTSSDIRSVQQVGRYSLEEVFPFESWRHLERRAAGGLEFERAVQTWLQDLAEGKASKGESPELRAALEEHVLPALEQGVVRAAHPRETKVTG